MININGEIIKIYLQDVDGITVNSTQYKLAQGAKIFIPLKKYPDITFKSNIGLDTDISAPIDGAKSYTETMGPVANTGFARPTIILDAIIPIDPAVSTENNYFKTPTTITSAQTVCVNYYLLFLMHLHNHRLYLTDIDAGSSYPNLGTPINILQNRKDYFGNNIFTTKGVPVVITNIHITGQMLELKNEGISQPTYLECKIELVIDNYGT
ncbi:MAG: hypothetical protein PHC31_10985 [Clostridia bacterium]|nr:hypothetical protein [Clostridia bacterium]